MPPAGIIHFTLDYSNFPGQKAQLLELEPSKDPVDILFPLQDISYDKSTFITNWTNWNIEDIVELREVEINISFELTDKNGNLAKEIRENKIQKTFHRVLSFRDFSDDILVQVFLGGEAIIFLSAEFDDNCEMSVDAETKPKLL